MMSQIIESARLALALHLSGRVAVGVGVATLLRAYGRLIDLNKTCTETHHT